MNIDGSGWLQFFGLLMLPTMIVVLLGIGAARILNRPRWRVAVWQTVFLGLALVCSMNMGGAKRELQTASPVLRVTSDISTPPPETETSERIAQVAEPLPPSEAPTGWPALAWAIGSVVLSGRIVIARMSLLRSRFQARRALAETLTLTENLSRELGVSSPVILRWSALRGPSAFGILRPTIALPEDFHVRFSVDQQQAMLAHELAHLAARDPFWTLASEILCAAMWWNPVFWLAKNELLAATELAADEAATCVENGRTALAESLLILGREIGQAERTTIPVLAGEGLRSGLSRRVHRLLHHSGEWHRMRQAPVWLTRAGALIAVGLLARQLPQAAPPAAFSMVLQPMPPANWSQQIDRRVTPQRNVVTDAQFSDALLSFENASRKESTNAAGVRTQESETSKKSEKGGSSESPAAPRNESASTNNVVTLSGILTDPQFRKVVQALEKASGKESPPAKRSTDEVTVRVQMAEISETELGLGLDWLFGKVSEKEPMIVPATGTNFMPGSGVIKGKDVNIEHLRFEEQFAVLSREQDAGLKAALERQSGVDFLAAPAVTTVSGHQAQISVMDAQTIVTDQGGGKTGQMFGTEPLYIGPVVDIIPTAVDELWQLRVVATYTEFLGYGFLNGDAATPLRAKFRVRDAAATATVASGETLVIRGVPVTETRHIKGGMFRRAKAQEVRKRLYIFVTPESAQ